MHPTMTHPRRSTERQFTEKGSAAAGLFPWKESSLGLLKVPHTHTAGFPRSAVLAQPQQSAASGRDQPETSAGFQLFPFQMPCYTHSEVTA